jgi:hypothetical protein
MDREERFNAISWLLIYISLLIFIYNYNNKKVGVCDSYLALIFLVGSLLFVSIFYFTGSDKKVEGFSVTPGATQPFQSVTVAPTYASEWHEPPFEYTVIQDRVPDFDVPKLTELEPSVYPYSQYVSNVNLLPYDDYVLRVEGDGTEQFARNFVNDATTRHDLAFREESTRIHKLKMARKFRQSCSDTFSPLSSY